jgi:hypothetical protein
MNTTTNIDQQLKEYLKELEKGGKDNIFQTCEKLSHYARELICDGETGRLKTCFNAIEQLYYKANFAITKLAIENVFIYNIGGTIMLQPDRKMWTKLLPKTLREKMFQQFLASGI